MLVLIHGFYMNWDDICHLAEQMFAGEKFDPLHAPPGVTYVDPRETDSCVICLEDLDPKLKELYCKAQCGTKFHEPCIKGWLANFLRKSTIHPLVGAKPQPYILNILLM